MDEDREKIALMHYVNAASDLAELVRADIAHEGVISKKTVLALNKFIISANDINDLKEHLNSNNETDNKLN